MRIIEFSQNGQQNLTLRSTERRKNIIFDDLGKIML